MVARPIADQLATEQDSAIGFSVPCAFSLANLLARAVRAIGSPAASTINKGNLP